MTGTVPDGLNKDLYIIVDVCYLFCKVSVWSGWKLFHRRTPYHVKSFSCLYCQMTSSKYAYQTVGIVCSSNCFHSSVSDLSLIHTSGTPDLPQFLSHCHGCLRLQERFQPSHLHVTLYFSWSMLSPCTNMTMLLILGLVQWVHKVYSFFFEVCIFTFTAKYLREQAG